MGSGQPGTILRSLDQIFGEGSLARLSESELLGRFAGRRDEAAFGALVDRHGPMVLGVCRRILGGVDSHAAEDAFQAVFLILVKKAGSIRDGERLGPWLHGVARKVALRAREQAGRRRAVERPGAEEAAVSAPTDGERPGLGLDPETRAVLDEEVDRLPEKYRAPVVLCYLEGLTHDQAALRLGWPVGTVRSRMAWARETLRRRLTRRGLTGGAALVASACAGESAKAMALTMGLAPSVPSALLHQTIRAAMHVASHPGGALVVGAATAPAVDLARGAIQAMFIHKLKVGALAVATLCATAGGGAALMLQEGRPTAEPSRPGGARAAQVELAALREEVAQLKDQLKQLSESREEERLAYRATLDSIHAMIARQPAGEPLRETLEQISRLAANEFAASRSASAPTGFAPVLPAARAVSASSADPFSGTVVAPPAVSGRVASVALAPAAAPRAGAAAVAIAPAAAPAVAATTAAAPSARAVGVGGQAAMAGQGFGGVATISGRAVGFGGRVAAVGEKPEIVDMRKVASSKLMAVWPKEGGRISAFSDETGAWQTLELSEGVEVTPIINDQLIALMLEAPSVDRIAAFAGSTGTWYEQELREPVEGRTPNLVWSDLAVYSLGRYVYAFSSVADRWDTLDLGEGAHGVEPEIGANIAVVTRNGKIHTFSVKTGTWSTLDTDAPVGSKPE